MRSRIDEEPKSDSTTARLGSADEIAKIRQLYADGHVGAALALAEKVTARDNVPPEAIPELAVTQEELYALPLDHREAFMLTRIDGESDVRALLDVAGMGETEALTLIAKLETLGALRLLMEASEEEETIPRSIAGRELSEPTIQSAPPHPLDEEETTAEREVAWPSDLRDEEKTAPHRVPWMNERGNDQQTIGHAEHMRSPVLSDEDDE